ncbi:hypothetical protein [Streptomyces exfoliatus]|uniref:hypothetical protein n=1 Tax=Streptomyces exfoliatus TaxID=1905 RepID=UPI0037979070
MIVMTAPVSGGSPSLAQGVAVNKMALIEAERVTLAGAGHRLFELAFCGGFACPLLSICRLAHIMP